MNQICIQIGGIYWWLIPHVSVWYNKALHLWLNCLLVVLTVLIWILDWLRCATGKRLELLWEMFSLNLIQKVTKLSLHPICFTLSVESNRMWAQPWTLISFHTTCKGLIAWHITIFKKVLRKKSVWIIVCLLTTSITKITHGIWYCLIMWIVSSYWWNSSL